MPRFGGHKGRNRSGSTDLAETKTAIPSLPSPAEPEPAACSNSPPPTNSVVPSRHELVFHCQLAHGSATREIKDFSNVRDLYARIAEAFATASSEVSSLCRTAGAYYTPSVSPSPLLCGTPVA